MTAPAIPDAERLPGAQTTVQLFEQLRQQQCGDAELYRVRGGCALALQLFAGRMHACGKPYLAHCTAAASTTAALGADTDLILAALVHGAYMWGDFGGRRVLLRSKRPYLRRHLGDTVERYVLAFHRLPWGLGALAEVRGRLESLDAMMRSTVLLRLVSDLDNLRDGAILYRGDAEQARETMRRRGPLLVELAERLGYPPLARALAAEVAKTLDRSVPAELRSTFRRGALIAPASARLRAGAAVSRFVAASLRRVPAAKGSRNG